MLPVGRCPSWRERAATASRRSNSPKSPARPVAPVCSGRLGGDQCRAGAMEALVSGVGATDSPLATRTSHQMGPPLLRTFRPCGPCAGAACRNDRTCCRRGLGPRSTGRPMAPSWNQRRRDFTGAPSFSAVAHSCTDARGRESGESCCPGRWRGAGTDEAVRGLMKERGPRSGRPRAPLFP